MRGLTVRQPWAWAIAHAGKTIENRVTPWAHRGPLAIHAGLGTDDDDAIARLQITRASDRYVPAGRDLTRGAIIAVAWLTNVHDHTECSTIACERWGHPGCWHLELDDVYALPVPVPAKGSLGLWLLPAAARAQVVAQLPDTYPLANRARVVT